MLAMIDASHAAHIYGTAGGSIIQPTLRDFEARASVNTFGGEFEHMPPNRNQQAQHQSQQQRNAFAAEMMPPPMVPVSAGGHGGPALVDGPWNM